MRVPEDLSPPERRLWAAFNEGGQLDLAEGRDARTDVQRATEWGPERRVRAAALTALVRCVREASGGATALGLSGARITGALCLRHLRAEESLFLENCSFDEPVDIAHAELLSLSFRGSRVPGVDAYGVIVRGDLMLSHVIAGKINLFGARVGGRLWLVGARLTCADGYALDAPDMAVSGGLYCGGEFTAHGGVNLYGASVGAGFELDGARLVNSRGFALRAPNLVVASDLTCSNAVFTGGINVFGAEVGGQFWLNATRLTNADGWALNAANVKVGGGLYSRGGMAAEGGVNLYGATIGAGVELESGKLVNRRGAALRAPHVTVAGDFTCDDGFSAVGGVELSGCRIEGRLSFRGAALGGAEPAVLTCTNAEVRELFLDRLQSAPGVVSLSGAAIEVIHDDPGFRPENLDLDRAQYVVLTPYRPARVRVAWVRRGRTDYRPWCYEQLAAYYRRIGHDEDARTVLLAKQRHRRGTLRLPAKLWGRLQDVTVGYGYRPLRALGWLGSGIAATAVFFALNPPKRTAEEGAPHFSAPVYAVDVFLPVLDLGQQRAFTPQGTGQWVAWAAVLAGWVLATTVIAGITRNLARA
ncbi:hypothetical protein AB0B79_34320 [Streptomyces sp. NPDC039022]|uniref:hypothetical protein n=1 Tax=Streptomyces sp. NPDC039022 TaxID=3157091 RepID=UPI0033DBE484